MVLRMQSRENLDFTSGQSAYPGAKTQWSQLSLRLHQMRKVRATTRKALITAFTKSPGEIDETEGQFELELELASRTSSGAEESPW